MSYQIFFRIHIESFAYNYKQIKQYYIFQKTEICIRNRRTKKAFLIKKDIAAHIYVNRNIIDRFNSRTSSPKYNLKLIKMVCD